MPHNWKVKTPRDKSYLKWIDGQDCCICSGIEVTHHHVFGNGMGIKCSDYDTLPVCCVCHDMIHRYYTKQSYWKPEQLKELLEHYQAKYEETQWK